MRAAFSPCTSTPRICRASSPRWRTAALGSIGLLLDGLGALLSFMAGAACSAVLIHWGRREHLHSEYALPLLLEAFLLLVFGLLGGNWSGSSGCSCRPR